MRDDTGNHSRYGRPGTRPQVRARLSSLSSLASATGHDVPVAEDPCEEAAVARPHVHVALADAGCRRRVADKAGRFGWDVFEHPSAAALLASLQGDPNPTALVVVDAQDAASVRAVGAGLSLLVVRPADVELAEDDLTKVASADALGRALIDVAGRLRARSRTSPPMLRAAAKPSTTAPHAGREAS
jgi:hypothetical protein